MSYTVGLLIGPAPTTNAEAFDLFAQLNDAADPDEAPHPTFVKLHAQLTERFPCICNLSDEDLDEGVWCDGPLINNFGERTAVIGCVFSAVAKTIPFVVATALGLGVTVFDWQTNQIHRPPSS